MKTSTLFRQSAILLAAAFIIAVPATSQAGYWWGGDRDKEVVGYFIEWGIYGRNYRVKNIVDNGSAAKLTVINYAFGNVAPDANGNVVCQLADPWADYQVPWTAEQSVTGEAVTWPNPILGNFQQLKALKEIYPNIKVLISIGGWTFSKYFSDAALTEESRATLASSCIDLFIKGNLPDPGWGGMGGPGSGAGVFDGIDIDWEWPVTGGNPGNIVRPEDKPNYTKLLKEFRKQLDAVDTDLLLTIVTPANKREIDEMELGKIARYVDFVNMIGYDFHVSSQATTNHQANLSKPKAKKSVGAPEGYNAFSVEQAVRDHLRAGMPRHKLNVGVPFYGQGWTGVNPANNGLFQAASGPASSTFGGGVEDYKVLKDLQVVGYERFWDHHAKAAWLFDGTTFWTFDDPYTMCKKARFVREQQLGGIMFWELTGDDAQGSLISAIDNCLESRHREHRGHRRHAYCGGSGNGSGDDSDGGSDGGSDPR